MSSSIERLVDRQVLLWRLRQALANSTSSAGPAGLAKAKLGVQEPAPGSSEPAPSSGVRHCIPAGAFEQRPVKRALIR